MKVTINGKDIFVIEYEKYGETHIEYVLCEKFPSNEQAMRMLAAIEVANASVYDAEDFKESIERIEVYRLYVEEF